MLQILADVLNHARTVFSLQLTLLALPICLIILHHFQSPLYRFPGPFTASFTNLYRLIDVWRGSPHITLLSLHRRYGDIIRLGTHVLSFSNPDALGEIYGLKANFPKSQFYYPQQILDPKGNHVGSLFSVIDSKEHARMRKVVSGCFSLSALMRFESVIDSMTALFLEKTDEHFAQTGAECDLAQWLQFYAFDVICKITWGLEMGTMRKNEDVQGVFKSVERRFAYMAVVGQIPSLDLLLLKNPLLRLLSKLNLIHANAPIVRFAQNRLSERLVRLKTESKSPAQPQPQFQSQFQSQPPNSLPKSEDPSQPNDLMSLFLHSRDLDPTFFDTNRVLAMCMTMANAGSDTTAISIAAIFYYLLKSPACYRKLVAEIEGAVANGTLATHEIGTGSRLGLGLGPGLVSWSESQKLPYLDACIKEAFRLHPAVGLPLERVVPEGGATILGEWIPGGTVVGMSAWVVHMSRRVFGEDVERYRPERWIEVETEEERKRMERGLFHFGMGSRSCVGKWISLLEVYKVVPAVVRRLEIELVNPDKEWKLYNAWFVRQRDFKVRFRARRAKHGGSSAA